jgi:DNA-binding CsgD family transcriptional regulator
MPPAPPPLPILLENLRRYQRESDLARARVQRQLEACIAAGYNSSKIAAQLGCQANNVRSMRAWKERRR